MDTKIFGKPQVVPFTYKELARRVQEVRDKMVEKELDAVLIRSSESIYYLTGMGHYGFFAEHMLLVPAVGEMRLIAREAEKVTFEEKVKNASFHPFYDYENSYDRIIEVIKEMKLDNARWGMEKDFTSSVPYRVMEAIVEQLPGITWTDFSEDIMLIRITQSEEETAYSREAGRISTEMMKKVVELYNIGVREDEIVAEVLRVMALEGSEWPGFPVFVRAIQPGGRWMEHVAWQNNKIQKGDNLLVEMSGCVNHYHAPIGRLLFTEEPNENIKRMGEINKEAFLTVVENLKEGNTFGEVYDKWRAVLDKAGLKGRYDRRHCGYISGLSFPPSWCGGRTVISLQHSSNIVLKKGMLFHVHTSMYEKGVLDYMLTSGAVTGTNKGELLTDYPYEPITCLGK